MMRDEECVERRPEILLVFSLSFVIFPPFVNFPPTNLSVGKFRSNPYEDREGRELVYYPHQLIIAATIALL